MRSSAARMTIKHNDGSGEARGWSPLLRRRVLCMLSTACFAPQNKFAVSEEYVSSSHRDMT